MKKLFLALFATLLFLGGCAGQSDLTSLVSELNQFNTNEIMYVYGAGEKQTPSILGENTVFFRPSPSNGISKNEDLLIEKIKENPQIKVIVAHSYGGAVTTSTILSDKNDLFKEIKVILLAPVVAGSKKAGWGSGFGGKIASSFSSKLKTIINDLNPLGKKVDKMVTEFPSLKEKTEEVVCFFVIGDDHGPDESSSETFQKNFENITKHSVVLSRKTRNPHSDVLEMPEFGTTLVRMLSSV